MAPLLCLFVSVEPVRATSTGAKPLDPILAEGSALAQRLPLLAAAPAFRAIGLGPLAPGDVFHDVT